jgi:hypothetical protein
MKRIFCCCFYHITQEWQGEFSYNIMLGILAQIGQRLYLPVTQYQHPTAGQIFLKSHMRVSPKVVRHSDYQPYKPKVHIIKATR